MHWYIENGARNPKRTLKEIIVDHLSYGKVAKRDSLRFLALATAGEAGELANDVKKEWRGDRKYRGKAGRAAFLAKVDSEIVDLGNYVFMLAASRGLDLEAEMEKKLIEVEARDDDWNKKKGKRVPWGGVSKATHAAERQAARNAVRTNPYDNSCVPKRKRR